MNRSFFIAWVAALVVWMMGDFLVHGMWLNASYMANAALYRPNEDQSKFLVWNIVAHFLSAGAAAWMYGRGVSPHLSWLGQSLRFGIVLVVLLVPSYLIYYAVQPLPLDLVMKQCAGETGVLLAMGLAIGFVYHLTRNKAA